VCIVLWQNRGNGVEFISMVGAMTKELGYRVIINGFYNTNVRVHMSGKKLGEETKIVGVVPRVGYIVGYGWADEMLAFTDLTPNSVPTFTEWTQKNRSHL